MNTALVFLLVTLFATAVAFQMPRASSRFVAVRKLAMAEDDEAEKDPALSFNMNRIVRLGRSRDEVR